MKTPIKLLKKIWPLLNYVIWFIIILFCYYITFKPIVYAELPVDSSFLTIKEYIIVKIIMNCIEMFDSLETVKSKIELLKLKNKKYQPYFQKLLDDPDYFLYILDKIIYLKVIKNCNNSDSLIRSYFHQTYINLADQINKNKNFKYIIATKLSLIFIIIIVTYNTF